MMTICHPVPTSSTTTGILLVMITVGFKVFGNINDGDRSYGLDALRRNISSLTTGLYQVSHPTIVMTTTVVKL